MFLAAEAVALASPHRRLTEPFVAVLDELRYGIVPPNLPYVAAAQRKYGITFVYAVQSTAQEQLVYGPDTQALRAATLTIHGGIDIDSAREIADRSGTTPVVTTTGGSAQVQWQETWTIADQQRLRDGEATVVARGLAPFVAWLPSVFEQRRLDRRIRAEVDEVIATTQAARALETDEWT